MKTLSGKSTQQILISNMLYDEYELREIYLIYTAIMNRDYYLKFKVMSEDSLRRRLQAWASVEGGWLIKKGDRSEAVYYKRCCKQSDMSRKTWKQRAAALFNRAKEPKSWW
jgi:hypothetical protein